jgi:predicted phosphohydrolase
MTFANFQYFSDLHLEFYHTLPYFDIFPHAPYLVIAGDLGHAKESSYISFLTHMSTLFEYVFIISGNHEYHSKLRIFTSNQTEVVNSWMNSIEADIRKICAPLHNIIYLQNESFEIPNTNIVIYGTTLWSHIDDCSRHTIKNQITDYKYIPGFTTTHSNILYANNVKQLETTLTHPVYHDKVFVVISHHLPSYTLIHPKFSSFESNSAFASNVSIANDPRIVAWFAGHTHESIELGKFHINPIGYPGEKITVDCNKIVSVPYHC